MIIITGGSGGLGAELIGLFKDKHKILNISRQAATHAHVNIIADLSKQAELDKAVSQILANEEKIDAIIHSAGVLSLDPLVEITAAEFDRVFDVNAKAPILITSKIIDRLKKDESDIVFIGSTASIESYSGQAVYDASKHALKGYTDDLRLEMETFPSRVIGVYPGMLDTDMSQKIPGKHYGKSKHKAIDPLELAKLIITALEMPKNSEVSDIVIRRKVTRS